jgi:GntR family transcriptional regulator
MIIKPNPSLGVPIYLQLVEQVKHAIETGALRAGDQLPSIRPLAEDLVINANTVAKAYRELEREGVVELRQGAGAFVADTARARQGGGEKIRAAETLVGETVERLRRRGLSDDEIRRLFEAELAGRRERAGGQGG